MSTIDLDDIVSLGDLANLFGVGQGAVSNWKKRYDDFPRPVKVVGRTIELYSRSAVIDWWRMKFYPRAQGIAELASLLNGEER